MVLKICIFTPTWELIQFDEYVSIGLKTATSYSLPDYLPDLGYRKCNTYKKMMVFGMRYCPWPIPKYPAVYNVVVVPRLCNICSMILWAISKNRLFGQRTCGWWLPAFKVFRRMLFIDFGYRYGYTAPVHLKLMISPFPPSKMTHLQRNQPRVGCVRERESMSTHTGRCCLLTHILISRSLHLGKTGGAGAFGLWISNAEKDGECRIFRGELLVSRRV